MCEESINNKCVFDTHTLTHTHSTTCCANTKWMKQANNVSGNIYFTLFLLEYNALHPYVCRRACSRAVHTHDETHEKRKDTRRKKTHISDDHEDADDAETKTLSTMSDEFGTNGNRKCVEKRWRIKKKKKMPNTPIARRYYSWLGTTTGNLYNQNHLIRTLQFFRYYQMRILYSVHHQVARKILKSSSASYVYYFLSLFVVGAGIQLDEIH